jgi:ATP-dependent DNA helicase RecG
MSEYEIYSYEAFKKKTNDELRVLESDEFKELNQSEVTLFLAKLRTKKPNLSVLTDKKNLTLSGVYLDDKLTLAGLMLFGLYPQAMFPQFCITAVVVPGYNIGDTGVDDERFIDNKKIEGTIPQMIEGANAFIGRNMKEKTIIDQYGKRTDKTEYPLRAIREIILNAVIHRDYSFHTEKSPIRIIMYRDRIEVENPGGLYGRITLGNLGKVGADTRNPFIASNLEIMIDTENRFSGIPIIMSEMDKADLKPPVFENSRGVFKVTLYNERNPAANGSGNGAHMTDRLLDFCITPRTRAELAHFTGFSRYYTMSKIVQPLIDSDKLKLSLPDKPKSAKQMFLKAK